MRLDPYSRISRALLLLALLGSLVVASRLPLVPDRLFSYDSVNLAYAAEDFDPLIGYPQPPFYPLFVLEMRLLGWLGLDKAESVMLFLKIAASIAAVMLIVWAGELIFGLGVGLCAAWLLLFHHSFWYGGLTSALRIHLAVVSLAVAGTCYPGWMGSARGLLGSSLALGIGAGVRPELGALLFPLWIGSLIRSSAEWRVKRNAVALLAVISLAWLVPTIVASNGLGTWLEMSWAYLHDQSVLTSGLFGAGTSDWGRAIIRLLVWTSSGALIFPLIALPAWRGEDGFGIGALRACFLLTWLVPSFLFAALVHIADPGHGLAIVPGVCLAGGWMLSRTADRLGPWVGREHALLILLLPVLALNGLVFLGRFPLPKHQPSSWADRGWLELHDAIDHSSLWQVRRVARHDDRVLEQIGRLASERPGNAVVIWDGGDASFIKASYYYPNVPVYAIAPNSLQHEAPVVASKFLGRGPGEVITGSQRIRIRVRPGARVVWLVQPAALSLQRLRKQLSVIEEDVVYYSDLPREPGQADLGEYVLDWQLSKPSL